MYILRDRIYSKMIKIIEIIKHCIGNEKYLITDFNLSIFMNSTEIFFSLFFPSIAWHMRKIEELFNALSRFEKIILPRIKIIFSVVHITFL